MAKLRVEAFNERFRPDHGAAGPYLAWERTDTLALFGCEPEFFTEFMATQARSSYESGLIRFLGPLTQPSILAWNSPAGWRARWHGLESNIVVFAYDWMGRLYGLDSGRAISREPLVTRLDPGEAKLLTSDLTFAEFVLGDLVAYGDRLLGQGGFAAWRDAGGRPLAGQEVAGYIVPIFEAGTDEMANLEVTDLESYIARLGLAYSARHGSSRHSRFGRLGGLVDALRPSRRRSPGSAE